MPDKFDLRALVLLRVIHEFTEQEGRPPKQVELLARGDGDLFPAEWSRLGIDRLYPHKWIPNLVLVRQLTPRLRACGLMIPQPAEKRDQRRSAGKRKRMVAGAPYALTERGHEVARSLDDEWATWPTLDSLCPKGDQDESV